MLVSIGAAHAAVKYAYQALAERADWLERAPFLAGSLFYVILESHRLSGNLVRWAGAVDRMDAMFGDSDDKMAYQLKIRAVLLERAHGDLDGALRGHRSAGLGDPRPGFVVIAAAEHALSVGEAGLGEEATTPFSVAETHHPRKPYGSAILVGLARKWVAAAHDDVSGAVTLALPSALV